MSTGTISPEKLARLLHHYREALAPDFGLRQSTSPDWGDLAPHERGRMIAATRLALIDLQSVPSRGSPGEMLAVADFTGGSEGKECGC